MAERQALVEEVVGRPVTSLRDLTSREATGALERLGEDRRRADTGSSWDDRVEDTWIDRL
ncbi:hypothetical protein [Nocardioides sp. GY 10127]|uniref:hypothetical protein n=1 Tax=Nocardioides sp. GY 10127 TaxID=2569762 RepID=UPI0010A8D230|nr:hypothetical protein [Nocardioides sp. GY 10127]TIC84448.1 hypothetical protein E8D37_06710 [Nocardioides sp. GY 10127]